MLKKVLIGAAVFVLLLTAGLFFWARAVFTQDAVRTTLAAQLSGALGQPVAIGGIGATIYPRVTVSLSDVTIGDPPRIEVQTLDVGTAFGALWSRRLEQASLRLSGARIALPLPELTLGRAADGAVPEPGGTRDASPVEIVSIDEIVLRDVEITSGGRTLRGDIEVVPQGTGLVLRRVSLGAGDATIDITGHITDLSGPAGQIDVKAGALDFHELMAFVSDFAGSAGLEASAGAGTAPAAPAASAAAASSASTMDIGVSLEAASARMGELTLDGLTGRARLTPEALTLEPIRFGLFGGSYDGTLTLTLGAVPDFRINATMADLDMAAAMAFAGSPGTITGRLSGRIDLSGSGLDAARVLETAVGTARVDLTDGTVKGLGLVRTIVVATSGRSDAQLASATGSIDEPFSRLGATLRVAGGAARTDDLRFESDDLLLSAAGLVRLDGSAIDLKGQVQLSDELSKQAGRDLVRATQDQGRVTLPATITGSADSPQVRIDVAAAAKRALTNRAIEEAQGAIKRNLGGLLGR
jgi:uncharacterized protein involved in outer membrane biogenesis